MAQVLGTAIFLCGAGLALVPGVHGLGQLGSVAATLADAWHSEYAARGDGLLRATAANLDDAAQWLAARGEGPSEPLRQEARTLAGLIADAYANSFAASSSHLTAVLHRQRHQGQEPHCPNWTIRLVWLP